MMDEWAEESMVWAGDWREECLDPDEREGTSLVAMHDLQFYHCSSPGRSAYFTGGPTVSRAGIRRDRLRPRRDARPP